MKFSYTMYISFKSVSVCNRILTDTVQNLQLYKKKCNVYIKLKKKIINKRNTQ